MTMVEAIREVLERDRLHLWFRPARWRGLKYAYCIDRDGGVRSVPTSHGGAPAMFPNIHALLEEWEVVDMHEVVDGR